MTSDKPNDTGAFDGEPQGGFRVVGGHARAYVDDVDPGAGLERPTVEARPGNDNAVMIFQVGGGFRRSAPIKVCRRRTDHPLQVGDLALDERAFGNVAGANGDIGLLFDEVDQPVGDGEIDIDLGIAGEKIGERRGKLVQTEGGA